MDIAFDLTGFREQIAKKREELGAATRPAAQAGAQIIYEASVLAAPISTGKAHLFFIRGKKYGPFAPGALRSSIYQAFSKDHSGPYKSTYHISWNQDKAPYGGMVHNGTSHSAAHPFIAGPVHDFGAQALDAMKARYVAELSK